MYNLLIYSRVDRYLNCFQCLAIMNKAENNITMHIFWGEAQVLISFSSIPKRGTHRLEVCFTLVDTAKLFPKCLLPAAVYQISSCCISSTKLGIVHPVFIDA